MTVLSFKVTGSSLVRTDMNRLVTFTRNNAAARFDFDKEWAGVSPVVAQFRKSDECCYDVFVENCMCVIPWEVLEEKGTLYVSVMGGDLITTNCVNVSVIDTGIVGGLVPTVASPGVYSAVMEALENKADSSHTHTVSDITDFPESLKNPEKLTVAVNGAEYEYDGSEAKSIEILYDEELSSTSTNVIQNKAVTEALNSETARAIDAEERLGQTITETASVIRSEITSEVEILNNKIDTVDIKVDEYKTTLTEQIQQVESDSYTRDTELSTQLNNYKLTIESEIQQVNTDLQNKGIELGELIQSNDNILQNSINHVNSDMMKLSADVSARFTTNETVIHEVEEKVETARTDIYELQTIVSELNTTVDSELSSESENPVQNKVVTEALANKADADHSHEDINELIKQLSENQLNILIKLSGGLSETVQLGDDVYAYICENGDTYIAGSGEMYTFTSSTAPLKDYNITSADILNGVTSIGNYTFYNCTSLTSITIGNSVTSIGTYAFRGCSSLTSITIPDGVTRIGSNAFYGCTGLTSIEIPDSVTSIGDNAFYECSNLTTITINKAEDSISGSPWGAPSATVVWTGDE